MPSFVIHSIALSSLEKHLNISNDDQKRLFIGNLLPDAKNKPIDPNLSDKENRLIIQEEKVSTHFRTNLDGVLTYPDIDKFLYKYKKECSNNIMSLGYFFHLYTDYYFFNKFLPTKIKFLDSNNIVTFKKSDISNVLIEKNKSILSEDVFFSKTDDKSLYIEYNRLSNFLIKRYNLNINYEELINFINTKKLIINIDETSYKNSKQVIDKLNDLIVEAKSFNNEELFIFDNTDIDDFTECVVTSFLNKYDDLLIKYM